MPITARPPSAVLSAPDQGVTLSADEGTNTLVAVGEPRMLDQIERLLKTLDVRQPQVMVEAFVVALSRDNTLDLGVELQKLGVNGTTLGRLSSLFGLGSPDPGTGVLPPPSGLGLSGVVLDPKSYSAMLHALETVNKGRTLTVPHVLVNNNQQGKLDSVLQTPFTSTNASTTVATTSFGGTQDAGTMISVRPQIAEGDHLRLEYDVTVSAFVGAASNPALPPPRQQDKIQSIVTIPDGYTVVVGGLDIESDTTTTAEVPWLGRIWLLGWLFRSDTKETKHSRLFVFLRANVMRRENFEDLKFLSGVSTSAAALDDGTPRSEPRFIR